MPVFAYAKSRFSHDAAHISLVNIGSQYNPQETQHNVVQGLFAFGNFLINENESNTSPELSEAQGELIVYPCSGNRPSSVVVRPSSTIFKDLL